MIVSVIAEVREGGRKLFVGPRTEYRGLETGDLFIPDPENRSRWFNNKDTPEKWDSPSAPHSFGVPVRMGLAP